jgi:hypothetical protein
MITTAPAARSPWSTFIPTPPSPTTSAVLPWPTPAMIVAAPKPVGTRHPIGAIFARSKSSSMTMQPSSGITT